MQAAEQSEHSASTCFIVRSAECADVVQFNQTFALVGLPCSSGYFYTLDASVTSAMQNLVGEPRPTLVLMARGWFNARLRAACLREKSISDAGRAAAKTRTKTTVRDNPVN